MPNADVHFRFKPLLADDWPYGDAVEFKRDNHVTQKFEVKDGSGVVKATISQKLTIKADPTGDTFEIESQAISVAQ
jgi:hypothetical protein